ncbi:hypothetical protein QBC47DRAFT_375492 [Echria macrotheca]|uniref:BPL/LPL catalytic domain-containing protein n=1 Tax=Echria macrotheca TaxID=438768 RepID=A0AAJ0BI37_9PEZI|nr:hypothetical protein QBC47DRAFT_375492 [Echria macrotheca]
MMSPPDNNSQKSLPVSVVHSPRGGLVTYHGPGQTVLWPVLDLRSASYRQFTVRCYSRLLEDTTIAVLQRAMGLVAFTTDDPGVWVQSQAARNPAKIAALGVHLRRHVSALGTAVNVAMPRSGSGSSSTEVFSSSSSEEKTNPWARIVACGLEGRIVTSAAAEVDGGLAGLDRLLFQAREGGGEEEQMNREDVVAALWAGELAGRIGVDGVETVGREEVVGLLGDVLDGVDGDDDVSAEEWEYVRALRDGV